MKNFLPLIMLTLAIQFSSAQDILKFKVHSDKDRLNPTVSIPLDGLDYNTDKGALHVYELTGNSEKLIPSQIETGHSARIWIFLEGEFSEGGTREFILKRGKVSGDHSTISLKKDHKDLTLSLEDKEILSYRHAVTDVPDGVNPLYRRSGYIHPLNSPEGEVLTRIQPEDHYHHYGIWGPWTRTHIGERQVDFWNLKDGQGTVRFAGFLEEEEGAVYTGFKALQQHIDFGAKGADQIAINEILDVRAWNAGGNVWVVDYTTSINSPLRNGILLDAYRYGGGIGFRATERWHNDNCTVLTSDKKTRKDADGSFAKWCMVEGESDSESGRSGIIFLSHPSNRMHPEPMRIWPLNSNRNRGDMYFEFVPIRHEEWKLDPKTSYTLKYRMIIFDGEISPEMAEKYWNSFSSNPTVEVIK